MFIIPQQCFNTMDNSEIERALKGFPLNSIKLKDFHYSHFEIWVERFKSTFVTLSEDRVGFPNYHYSNFHEIAICCHM